MKKLFCLFVLGLIAGFAVCLCGCEKQQAEARIIVDEEPEEASEPCLSMALDSPLDPQSSIHRAGTGLGPIPRSAVDYHSQPFPSVAPQSGDTAVSRSVARAVAMKWAIWQQADTVTRETGNTLILKVRFLGGTAQERAHVKQVAPEWSKHANIRFEFVQSGASDIRVGFDPNDGHWSRLGKGASYIPASQKTMNLALRGRSKLNRVILHEFGHALGLKHEHQSPALSVQWDESVIIQELKQTQGWSEEKIRHNVINRLAVAQTNFSAFDRHSIMLYSIPNRWTIGNFETGYNTTLSAMDKQFIGNLYRQSAPVGPIARVLKIWTTYDHVQNGVKGMRIHVTFKVHNFKGKPGIAVAYFYGRNGVPLKDSNQRYWTQDGNISVGGNFQPGYVNTIYDGYTLFIPHSELHREQGWHDLKFKVQIFNQGTGKPLSSASHWYHFWANIG